MAVYVDGRQVSGRGVPCHGRQVITRRRPQDGAARRMRAAASRGLLLQGAGLSEHRVACGLGGRALRVDLFLNFAHDVLEVARQR